MRNPLFILLYLTGTFGATLPQSYENSAGWPTPSTDAQEEEESIALEQAENIQNIDNSMDYGFNNNQHDKGDRFETKLYSDEPGNERLPYYLIPLRGKLVQINGEKITYPPSTSASSNTELVRIARDRLDQFCWNIISQTTSTCFDVLQGKQKAFFNQKCTRGSSIDHSQLLPCGYRAKLYPLDDQSIEDDTDEPEIDKRNPIPKRLPFHAWGGKRTNPVGNEKIQASRVPFNAWGGKRSSKELHDTNTLLKRICCARMFAIKRYNLKGNVRIHPHVKENNK